MLLFVGGLLLSFFSSISYFLQFGQKERVRVRVSGSVRMSDVGGGG